MKVLFDIGHPAHVHFFKNPARLLQQRGHDILITSRDKECALDLLEQLNLQHIPLSAQRGKGILALGRELVTRDAALFGVVRQQRPDVMAAIGGIFIAQVGRLTGTTSLVFYDTENATLQNALTYPFASCVITPQCYQTWLPRRRHIRYSGYHELSYLHPNYFTPDRERAIANGLADSGDTFLLRLVSWQASHDIGERGWNIDLLRRLLSKLLPLGKILISAEGPLPEDLQPYRYLGRVSEIHHVMAFCRCYIGESATMASECAVLGIPAVFAAETGRGYTDEQESRYGLVRNLRTLNWQLLETLLDDILSQTPEHWRLARQALLADTLDVAAFVASCIETYPEPLHSYQKTLAG